MTATPGDLNEPWHRYPRKHTLADLGLSDFFLPSGGVKVFGAALTLVDGSTIPAVFFQFAMPDGSGFYAPMVLVAQPDELRALAPLVDQATAAALVAAHQANGSTS